MPPHAQERNRKACDKCHQQKLSCKKIGGGDECERCHRLKRPCTSSPPLRNQRNSTTRRSPREHDGSRRRPKTLAILPRSSPPASATDATAAATPSVNTAHCFPPASSYSYSSSESGSSYSQDQDTTAPVIPVVSDPLVTDTMHEQHHQHQQQQYLESLCWPVTSSEYDGDADFHGYFAPSWSEEGGTPKMGYLAGGDFTEKISPLQDIGIQSVCGFPIFDRDLDVRTGNLPPPGAHLVQLQPSVAAVSPITSANVRDPASIRGDLESPFAASLSDGMGFGPEFAQYAGYGLGNRARFDWQLVCEEPSDQGEQHFMLET